MNDTPRPRDALGRPLPRGSAPVEPDPTPLPPLETVRQAQRLLDEGRAFRAHEVLEVRWKACEDAERELWRGLAQLAVAVTHAQRGNRRGAVALLERAAATLAPWAGQEPYDIDVSALRDWAHAAAVRAAADGPAAVGRPPGLRRSADS